MEQPNEVLANGTRVRIHDEFELVPTKPTKPTKPTAKDLAELLLDFERRHEIANAAPGMSPRQMFEAAADAVRMFERRAPFERLGRDRREDWEDGLILIACTLLHAVEASRRSP